jgi:archaellum component FlaF (FlaF/FlaG flagellin family)
MRKSRLILVLYILIFTLSNCKQNGDYTFTIHKGEKRFEQIVASDKYSNKWIVVNSASFDKGDFNQEARFTILLDGTVVSDFEVIEKSVADSDFRYYFPLIQQPVLGAKEIKIIIVPLDGEFHTTFSFKISFQDENIQ